MIIKKIEIALIIFSMFIFFACNNESTEPEDTNIQADVETSLKEVDAMMGQTSSGHMVYALMEFQNISGSMFDFGLMPFTPEKLFNNSLDKKSLIQKYYDVKIDSGLVGLFESLQFMKGTHTYEDSVWNFSAEPNNAVVMVYPFISLEDAKEHIAKITITNDPLSDTNAKLYFDLKVDGVTNATINISVSGNNFISQGTESVLTSVSVSGQMINSSGLAADYSIIVTETNVQMTFGLGGLSLFSVTATGNNLLTDALASEGETDPQIDNVVMLYKGLLKLQIDDLQAEAGDVGNVYYEDKLAGDLIAEEDGLYIKFTNGNKVSLFELMPNTMNSVGVFGGIIP